MFHFFQWFTQIAVLQPRPEEMQSGKKQKTLVPDYTLYAKLIQQTDRNSKLTQNTYSFQMSLVQVKTGLTVWEDEKQISKQTKAKGALGW